MVMRCAQATPGAAQTAQHRAALAIAYRISRDTVLMLDAFICANSMDRVQPPPRQRNSNAAHNTSREPWRPSNDGATAAEHAPPSDAAPEGWCTTNRTCRSTALIHRGSAGKMAD